jgi:hypothetical protein
MRQLAAAGLALVIAACQASPNAARPTSSPASTTPVAASASPAATADRVTGWRSDLAALVPGMAAIHPKLDHGTPTADLDAAAASLSATVPTATDDQLMVGVLRIVAMVSAKGCDAHTGAYVWGAGTYPVDSLPLRLWWFDEGLYIVDALDPYKSLIGSRIDAVDGRLTAEVTAAIDPIIPRDNAATVRLLMPRFVLIPQILRGLGLADAGPVELQTVGPNGQGQTTQVRSIPMAAYNAWAGPYGLHLPANPSVPYLSRMDEVLWWEPLPDDPSTVFVQYNRAETLTTTAIASLRTALEDPGVQRVVVDIRHNYGGEVQTMSGLLDLFRQQAAARPGAVFLVTGRNTFSAAGLFAARLTATPGVVVVGEPMGGCPTTWADTRNLRLPYSGIVVNVSAALEVGVDASDTRLTIEPDLPAPLSPEDWAAGVDPALAVLAVGQP